MMLTKSSLYVKFKLEDHFFNMKVLKTSLMS